MTNLMKGGETRQRKTEQQRGSNEGTRTGSCLKRGGSQEPKEQKGEKRMKTLTTILIIAIACISFSAMADLRAYYGMEDSSNVMADGSAYGNDLEVGSDWWSSNVKPYTGNEWGPGVIGNAYYTQQADGTLSCAGRFEEEVTLAQANSLNFTGTYPDDPETDYNGRRGVLTIDLWMKYTECTQQQGIIQRYIGYDWGLAMNNIDPYDPGYGTDPDGSGHLEFQWGSETAGPNFWCTYTIPGVLSKNEWHHVIVTHDRTDGQNSYITAIVDDVLVSDNVMGMGGTFVNPLEERLDLFVSMGAYWGFDGSSNPDTRFFKGAIDEVYVYYDEVPEPSMLLALLALLGLRKK